MTVDSEWTAAYLEIQERVENDRQFMALVRAMTGYPEGNSRRCRVLANNICERLELDAEVFRGTVYGAALHRMPGSGF